MSYITHNISLYSHYITLQNDITKFPLPCGDSDTLTSAVWVFAPLEH